MLILIAPVQPIAMIYMVYDIILHIWTSSWKNAAVYSMFLHNEWVSEVNCPFTVSCSIFQVLCSTSCNTLCCRICNGHHLLVSVFLLSVSQHSHQSPSLRFSMAEKINQVQLFYTHILSTTLCHAESIPVPKILFPVALTCWHNF